MDDFPMLSNLEISVRTYEDSWLDCLKIDFLTETLTFLYEELLEEEDEEL
jgi:hypothetical protein